MTILLLLFLCATLTVARGEPLTVSVASNRFYRITTVALPENLGAHESLRFRVRGATGALEVQFLEADGRARFWRRVDIADPSGATVNVPLRFMRRDGTRSPRWNLIRHFAIYFRNPGTYQLDNFVFHLHPGVSAELSSEELTRIAFPNTTARSVAKPEMIILTDSTALDLPKLEEHLGKFIAQARNDLPFLGAPSAPPVLVVFANKENYLQFPPRFAKLLNAEAAPPASNGYTLQAVATSFWDPEQGSLRPVYLHEFAHSWFERVAALPSGSGGWLEEGLVNHYQLLFHPQDNFAEIVRQGISDPRFRMPLPELCSGKRIPMNRYWQAVTVVRMIMTQPKYRERLPSFFAGQLPTDWDTFAHDWLTYCRDTYGADK